MWNQFISAVNIRSNLNFEANPVILLQDGVFDNIKDLLPVPGRDSTQNHNSNSKKITMMIKQTKNITKYNNTNNTRN